MLLAPHVVIHIEGTRTKLFVTLFLILGLVVIGEIAGVVLGRAVRGAIRNRTLRMFDSVVGVGVMVLAVAVVAYLLATPLTSTNQPNLAAAVRGSKVLSQVDGFAPPWLKAIPNRAKALLDTSGLPEVLGPFGRTPIINVDAPDAALIDDPVVAAVRPSVTKIRGVAPGCQKVLEGTGFVVSPNRVMSNAHVVAGSETVTVEADGQTYDATVVSYDPDADISILDVPGLQAAPLPFVQESGEDRHRRAGARLPRRRRISAPPRRGCGRPSSSRAPTSTSSKTVDREVYTIRGTVRQGNSGGPMIDRQGRVLGVVFGAAVDDAETGFVLTAREVGAPADQARQHPARRDRCLRYLTAGPSS